MYNKFRETNHTISITSLLLYVCMLYVCIYVCMYVKYACMYVHYAWLCMYTYTGVWKYWATCRTFQPIFITLVLLPIYFVYSLVSIYQTFTRFIGQCPAWLAVSTPLHIHVHIMYVLCNKYVLLLIDCSSEISWFINKKIRNKREIKVSA